MTRPSVEPLRTVRRAVPRSLTALTACLFLSACAAAGPDSAEPAPAPGAAPGIVGTAAVVQQAPGEEPPSDEPTSVGPIRGTHEQESAAVQVRPAPSASASDGAGDGAGSDAGDQPGEPPQAGAPGDPEGPGGAQPPGGGAGGDLSDAVQYAQALETAVNGHRSANGLAPLAHDTCAYDVALDRATALIGQELAHAPLEPIFETCPTSAVAENLAKGAWSPAEAAQGWMDSEGHRANILNGDLTRGAVACVPDGGDPARPVMICAHVFLG